jgi:DNA-binding response OmpR family regulator
MSPDGERVTVLVVDDEREVADVYALRLDDEYETMVAYGGEEALEAIDETVDVVLLDRRMPDRSGDEVLVEIRAAEYHCRVIMLTAVDPGLDIVEMPFDDYLCKPVEKDDLVTAIEQQLSVEDRDEPLTEFLEVQAKLSLLESQLSEDERAASEEFAQLQSRATRLREKVDVDLEEIEQTFADVGRQPG